MLKRKKRKAVRKTKKAKKTHAKRKVHKKAKKTHAKRKTRRRKSGHVSALIVQEQQQ